MQKQGLDHQCGSKNNSILAFANITKGTLGTIKSDLITENTCFIPTWSAIGNSMGSKIGHPPILSSWYNPSALAQYTLSGLLRSIRKSRSCLFDSSKNGNASWLLQKIISTKTLNQCPLMAITSLEILAIDLLEIST